MSKTITFADFGQDFLDWDLNDEGVVIDCRPAQNWLWKDKLVINHKSLVVGSMAVIAESSSPTGKLEIKYPIIEIKDKPLK